LWRIYLVVAERRYCSGEDFLRAGQAGYDNGAYRPECTNVTYSLLPRDD
jgi:hypothetical protein